MNKKIKAVIALTFLIITSFSILIPTVDAASPTSYVTITLTNSQTTATPQNFSQLIKVNWSAYAPELNANVSNVRFYNSTLFSSSTELSGWIEDNNTTTATSSNVWVNLSGTIVPASGSATIYMTFLPTTASWSSHWGLAPQLSTVYGKFDNGAKVFEFYDNFSGTSLSNKWTLESGSLTINNGLEVATATAMTLESSKNVNPEAVVQDIYGYLIGGSGQDNVAIGYPMQKPTNHPQYSIDDSDNGLYYGLGNYNGTTSTQVQTTVPIGSSIYRVFSIWINTTESYITFNYTNTYTNSGGFSATTSEPITVYAGGITGSIHIQWIRTRAIPPDGVMPNVIIGTLHKLTTYNVTFTSSILYDHTWNISIGTTNHIQTINTTQFSSLLNGTYTYNASVIQPSSGDMYHIKNLTGTFKIDGSNLTIPLNFVTPPIHSFAIPIKLYNNQTSSVVVNTPILIHVDWAKYFPYILNNVSNVRFYTNNEHYYTIYELPAWLQSGNYLNTTSSVWINLEADSIPAHSSIVIYMYINGSNTWNKYWGESPLLSSTYAKHDNGANVFQVYWNFAGTSMAGWNHAGTGSGAASGMNNGLQQYAGYGQQTTAVNTTPFTTPYIFDVNISYYDNTLYSNNTFLTILSGDGASFNFNNPFGFASSGMSFYNTIPDGAYFGVLNAGGGIGTIGASGISASSLPAQEFSMYWSSTQYLYHNYNTQIASTTVGGTLPSTYYFGWSMSDTNNPDTSNQTVHYLDGRIVPPNNVLPGVQIEPANVSTIQFNETGLPSGQAWSVSVNGVITTSTTSTITVFTDTGTYSYTTNTSNDVDFKILPKSGSINVSAFTDYYVNIDYINISYPVVFYQNTLISGVSWSVWLNNTTVQKELTSTGNTVTFYATNGTYTYFVMTSVFDAVTFTVSPQTGGLSVDGPSFTYLTNITFTYSAYEVVFSQNGLIYPQSWSLVIDGTTYNSNSAEQVIFWGNAHKNYSASINSPTPQIHPEQKTYNFTLNSSLSYTVNFVIDVTIVESGYTGEWHAIVNTAEYSSNTNTIVAEVVPGYVSISIWITDTGYTITPAQIVYSNAMLPFTLNVTFSQTPTNYVTSIFGNLTFIYLIVFIGIAIFAAILVVKLRRR